MKKEHEAEMLAIIYALAACIHTEEDEPAYRAGTFDTSFAESLAEDAKRLIEQIKGGQS